MHLFSHRQRKKTHTLVERETERNGKRKKKNRCECMYVAVATFHFRFENYPRWEKFAIYYIKLQLENSHLMYILHSNYYCSDCVCVIQQALLAYRKKMLKCIQSMLFENEEKSFVTNVHRAYLHTRKSRGKKIITLYWFISYPDLKWYTFMLFTLIYVESWFLMYFLESKINHPTWLMFFFLFVFPLVFFFFSKRKHCSENGMFHFIWT